MQLIRQYGARFAYLFGIPLIALLVFQLSAWRERANWADSVRADFPRANAEEMARRSLDSMCSMDALSGLEPCTRLDRLNTLFWLAIVTVVATGVLLGLVRALGRRCRSDRQLLLRVFRRGSIVISLATLGAIVSLAVLFCSTVIYLFGIVGRIPGGLVLFTLLGAVVAIYKIIRLMTAFNRQVTTQVDGTALSREQAGALWAFVDSIARSVGTEPPVHILAGNEATFFVTETPVVTSEGKLDGRVLYLSLPLSQILTKSELRSVIGHEMAHFHGQDTEFSRKFYPVLRGSYDALEAVVHTAQSVGGGGYALLPAIHLLSFYVESFSEAEAAISRERELEADAVGARASTARDLGIALTKIELHNHAWNETVEEMLNGGQRQTLLSARFLEIAEASHGTARREEVIASLMGKQMVHPVDSHPPLGVRLAALGLCVEDLYEESGQVRISEPSSAMLPAAAELERALLPDIAVKSPEIERIFQRRQAGFAAMEYHSLILNRTYLVYVTAEGLYALKMVGWVSSSVPNYFEPLMNLLDDPLFKPGTAAFDEMMRESGRSFFLPYADLTDVEFDHSRQWGMSGIPHAGKLWLRTEGGKRRKLILLGNAYGEGIRRYILERRERRAR